MQTVPGKGCFTIFRLYGPLDAWFDKTCNPEMPTASDNVRCRGKTGSATGGQASPRPLLGPEWRRFDPSSSLSAIFAICYVKPRFDAFEFVGLAERTKWLA